MLRMPRVESLTSAALAGAFPVVSVVAWLTYRMMATGLQLDAVEILGVLVFTAISFALGWQLYRASPCRYPTAGKSDR